jgi:polar amino acid transport system substrate-binding protein
MRFINSVLLFAIVALFPNLILAKEYSVGVEAIDYYPLYAGHEEEYKGFSRALLDAFAKDSGYTFNYVPLPVARLYDTFLTGDSLDFKFPDNEKWSQKAKEGKNIVYSEPLVQYIDGVFILPENKAKPAEDLKTLGIIRGFTAWEYMDRIESGSLQIEESNDYDAMLMKAVKGRVDGAYSSVVVIQDKLDKMGESGSLIFAAHLPHTRSAYHLSSIKHPKVIEEFNAWMGKNADTVQSLKQKYKVEP